MAKFNYLVSTVPYPSGIIFCRIVCTSLSIAALALYGTGVSVYNKEIAPAGSNTPLHTDVKIFSAVSITAATLSVVWSLTILALLARRMLQAHRRHTNGLATADEAQQVCSRKRPLVHPGWEVLFDTLAGALMIAGATLTGRAWNSWKTGTLGPGWEGTTPVKLATCPSLDPVTGVLNFWCTHAWFKLLDLMFNGMNILSPTAGIQLTQSIRACFYLYYNRRRYSRMGNEGCGKHFANKSSVASPSHQPEQFELQRPVS